MRTLILALAIVAALPLKKISAQMPQATVRILVESGGEPLGNVRIVAGSATARTGPDGRASLSLPPGTLRIVASRMGYEPAGAQLLLRAGQDTTITLSLSRQAGELDELVVSVTRSTRRVADEPARIEVIGEEEIAEKVMMTPGDIAMLLNETGGLRVQQTSPSLGAATVRVQGLRGRYTLLLSDGLPLHGEAAGGPGLLQVPPMDLGRVEVLKGASSSLYGGSALGGVVNLVARRPSGERDLLLNATSQGGTDAASWLSGILSPEWGWSLYSGWHRQERRDLDDDGWTDIPRHHRVVVRPRLHYEDGRGRSLFATAGATIEDRTGGTLDGRTAPDGQPWAEENRSRRFDLGVSGRTMLGDATFLSARASALTQRHRHQFGPAEEPDRHTTGFLEAALSHGIGGAVLGLGAAWQGTWYRNEAVPGFDFSHSVPGVFAQAEWDPSDLVAVGATARLDHHNQYGTFASPRINLLVRPADGWSARLSGGAGFFGPTPLVEEVEATGLGVLRQAGVLRAERIVGGSLDIGWRGEPFEFGGTLFASRVSHPVATTPVTGGGAEELLLGNQAEPVRTHGAELLARVHHEGLHLTASYTWISASEARDGESRRPVHLNPRHALGVVGMYEWEELARIGVELYAIGRQPLDDNPYRAESRSYLLLGALVERAFGGVRVFVNFENITDVRQTRTDPLVRPSRGPGGRWTTDAWAPLEGRVINGGVRIRWGR
jgi:iron complex outermembrane receptor protein